MEGLRSLSDSEMEKCQGGEAISLAVVLAVMAIGILIIVGYRMFKSDKGKVVFPGGYQFQWGK